MFKAFVSKPMNVWALIEVEGYFCKRTIWQQFAMQQRKENSSNFTLENKGANFLVKDWMDYVCNLYLKLLTTTSEKE
jgi:hypothetical protein